MNRTEIKLINIDTAVIDNVNLCFLYPSVTPIQNIEIRADMIKLSKASSLLTLVLKKLWIAKAMLPKNMIPMIKIQNPDHIEGL